MKSNSTSPIDELCPMCKGAPRRHLPKGLKILCPKCKGTGKKTTAAEKIGDEKKHN